VLALVGLVLPALGVAPAGASVPEIGRCLKVKAGTGAFGNSGCTATGGTKTFEWRPGANGATFTMAIKEATKGEVLSGESVTCTGQVGFGDYSGPDLVYPVVMNFSGCTEHEGGVCTSPGRAAGEIVTSTLWGYYGIVATSPLGAAHDKAGLKLHSAVEAEPFAFFECVVAGLHTSVWVWGSLIVPTPADKYVIKATLKWSGTAKKQTPERFEGEPFGSFLEAEFGIVPPFTIERAGLKLTSTLENNEPIEVNTVL
jgi:hypothetical protein